MDFHVELADRAAEHREMVHELKTVASAAGVTTTVRPNRVASAASVTASRRGSRVRCRVRTRTSYLVGTNTENGVFSFLPTDEGVRQETVNIGNIPPFSYKELLAI